MRLPSLMENVHDPVLALIPWNLPVLCACAADVMLIVAAAAARRTCVIRNIAITSGLGCRCVTLDWSASWCCIRCASSADVSRLSRCAERGAGTHRSPPRCGHRSRRRNIGRSGRLRAVRRDGGETGLRRIAVCSLSWSARSAGMHPRVWPQAAKSVVRLRDSHAVTIGVAHGQGAARRGLDGSRRDEASPAIAQVAERAIDVG
jgi:hypothetical protein